MATDCITQVTFHGDGFAKPMVARLDQPQASTDGGLVLLKALDIQLGLSKRVAGCLDDAREPGKVRHEAIELLQQRLFGLCAGYADCNDAARLVHDPIHKLVLGAIPSRASAWPRSRRCRASGVPAGGLPLDGAEVVAVTAADARRLRAALVAGCSLARAEPTRPSRKRPCSRRLRDVIELDSDDLGCGCGFFAGVVRYGQ